jgi:hypothetical protein
LFSPVGRKVRSHPHQFLRIEVQWLLAVDDCCGDVRCEPAQAQQDIDVAGRNALFACDVMDGELRIFSKSRVDVMGACDDPQKTHVGVSVVVRPLENLSEGMQGGSAQQALKPRSMKKTKGPGVSSETLRACSRPPPIGAGFPYAAGRFEIRRMRMKSGTPKPVRCAVYTRVSTDQGLEQDFNSRLKPATEQ